MAHDPADVHSATFTWIDPSVPLPKLAQLSGFDYLTALKTGELPPPPIVSVMRLDLAEVRRGEVVFLGHAAEAHFNPLGTIHGGWACTALDTALGCAVHSTLDAGTTYTSIDINVSYLRPIQPSTEPLRITGTVTKPGSRVAFAEGRIEDPEGRVVATATSSLLVFPIGG
ncbi:PaaI family thioesterase [Agromyces protaetiae]|uniref:PaaI family thioesterase n=1 Tax=Agromyces protaetiae TaxID=2509455 RepID=A0A4P6FI22_9MICO|nr:PaaI family thioesterase [Agromyces protaetiae]QAY74209.1 PaaI family thioesterase [Agromyces protaetiae]